MSFKIFSCPCNNCLICCFVRCGLKSVFVFQCLLLCDVCPQVCFPFNFEGSLQNSLFPSLVLDYPHWFHLVLSRASKVVPFYPDVFTSPLWRLSACFVDLAPDFGLCLCPTLDFVCLLGVRVSGLDLLPALTPTSHS